MKHLFLDLGKQPITNAFLEEQNPREEFFYHLQAEFDDQTKLVSLKEFVKPELMFNDTYAHRASMSRTMRESFKAIADQLKTKYNPKKILEIGSNDGVFIRNFETDMVVAVEPCENLADITTEMGYTTYPVFWGDEEASKIIGKHGKMDIIFSANTVSHIPDLVDTFGAVEKTLTTDGVFIFEDPSLLSVMNNGSYDQFYDEHAHVFSILALDNLLKSIGLEIFEIENLTTHGGSNRLYVKKKRSKKWQIAKNVGKNISREKESGLDHIEAYLEFAKRVQQSKNDLVKLLDRLKKEKKKIISYGATYKSATIFNYCQLGNDYFDCITDTTLNKQGKFSPGMHIPIISPEEGFNATVDYVFLGAWNFKDEIMAKEHEFIEKGGKFLSHVPEVRVL
jgi:hypothetical protein